MVSALPLPEPTDVASFRLVLKASRYLHCSLHKLPSSNLSELAAKLKEDNQVAIVNAKRLVSLNQLLNAANQSVHRRNPTWDTVFGLAGSSHLGHVLKDYAFIQESTNAKDLAAVPAATEADGSSMVVIFQINADHASETYRAHLSHYNLTDSVLPDICGYFNEERLTRKDVRQELKSWYKLTDQEIEGMSFESCVLTKIATKMM
jgi:hypothetical protein